MTKSRWFVGKEFDNDPNNVIVYDDIVPTNAPEAE